MNVSSSIQSRISALIRYAGLTPHGFAEKTGIPVHEVYAVTGSHGIKPSFDVIARIMRSFDFINPEWLILGKGKMVKNVPLEEYFPEISARESLQEYITGSRLRILPIAVDGEGDERITMVPIKSAAGYLTRYHDPEYIGKLPAFNLPDLPAGTYRAFEVEGDSMQDRIQPGDWVIARYLDDWTRTRNMHLHVIVGSDGVGIVVKRIINTLHTGCPVDPLLRKSAVSALRSRGAGDQRNLGG